MNAIKQSYRIARPPDEVWHALTDPEVIRQWSGSRAEYPLEPGASYSLWDGSIRGEIVEVVPLQRLVKTWKPVDWTRQDSVVTFTLSPLANGTRVDLVHENVEESDYNDTDEGWDIYYLGAMKRMLEAAAPAKRAPAKKAPARKAAAVKWAPARKTAAVRKRAAPKKIAAAKRTTTKKAKPRASARGTAKRTTRRTR